MLAAVKMRGKTHWVNCSWFQFFQFWLTSLCFCSFKRKLSISHLSQLACKGIAIALHYFFLVSFAWMALEGVMLYLKLVKVFHTKTSSSKTKKIFFSLGWGKFYHYHKGAYAKTTTIFSSSSLQITNSHWRNCSKPFRIKIVHWLAINSIGMNWVRNLTNFWRTTENKCFKIKLKKKKRLCLRAKSA